jgi:hypothetical protein
MLSRRLPSDWLPQLHPQSGEPFYFNISTGEARRNHPNLKQAEALAARERARARAQMDRRFTLIADYKRGVVESAERVVAGCDARLSQLRAEHVDRWLAHSSSVSVTHTA